ncbi:IS701 family transposase [Streptomyces sp. NPDC003697]
MQVISCAAPQLDPMAAFSAEIFSPLPRADQRRWAEIYLRGLLITEGKKSIRRIANAVSIYRADQSLQQFINQSPWDWEPVRALTARYVDTALAPTSWSIERIIIPKRGDRSVGVQRRFVPEAGRIVNSQLALGIFLSAGELSIPADWRIALTDGWNQDAALRRAAYIPDSVSGKPEWFEVLSMINEMTRHWKLAPVPVVGDLRHFTDVGQLIAGLAGAGADFALQVDGSLFIIPANRGAAGGRGAGRGKPGSVVTVREYLTEAERKPPLTAPLTLTRVSSRSAILSSLARIPIVQPSHGRTTRIIRVIGEWNDTCGFTRFWVTNLLQRSLSDVLDLARNTFHNRVDEGVITSEYGLRDFEGRSYRGLHHHLTMVSAAAAYAGLSARPDYPAQT